MPKRKKSLELEMETTALAASPETNLSPISDGALYTMPMPETIQHFAPNSLQTERLREYLKEKSSKD